jgi:hypothetical protein
MNKKLQNRLSKMPHLVMVDVINQKTPQFLAQTLGLPSQPPRAVTFDINGPKGHYVSIAKW